MIMILVWNNPPTVAELDAALQQYPMRPVQLWLCFQGAPPRYPLPTHSAPPLAHALHRATRCAQAATLSPPLPLLPQVDLRLIPHHETPYIHAYAQAHYLQWQTEALPQQPLPPEKPWLTVPSVAAVESVAVIGAGIVGAATAFELARHGVPVRVLEAADAPARAASGNRQGLLYAKISAHATTQTQLLLAGYGYTRLLLETLLPEREEWDSGGILHLNFNDAETRRHRQLAEQGAHHAHLYRAVTAAEASAIAGVPVTQDALYWQQGAWLHPPALVNALLSHENISLYTHCALQSGQHDGTYWQLHTTQGSFRASHLVLCCGAQSAEMDLLNGFPVRLIRGQTAVAAATPHSRRLRVALSGESYLAPAWRDAHTFGASFIANDGDSTWRDAEQHDNCLMLQQLHPDLAAELNAPAPFLRGHAAVRCDSRDHLPLVGALGDVDAMLQTYAALAKDKNYRIHSPCPYLPNVWTNTAHGSRGLVTAPLCAAEIAAQILGLPAVLSHSLRHALHPNRLPIARLVRGEKD